MDKTLRRARRDMSDNSLLFWVAVGPLLLLAAAAVVAHFLRRSVGRSMNLSASGTEIDVEEPPAQRKTPEQSRLSLRRLNLLSTNYFTAPAAVTSEVTHRAVLTAFSAAGLAYSAITTSVIIIGMYSLHHYHPDVIVAVTYMLQWPILVTLLWPMGLPLRTKVSFLGIYLGLGFLLTALASSVSHAALLAETLFSFVVLSPLAGVIPLLIRQLRPWLLAMVAVVLFLLVGAITFALLQVPMDLAHTEPWAIALGFVFLVLAVIVVGWMLRGNSWKWPLGGLASMTVLGILFIELHKPTIGYSLIALPSNVAQVFGVWLLFKTFVHLQERQFLPSQVLHSHLCWGVLTFYLVVAVRSKFYGHRWWQPWAVVLAYIVYVGILHVSLHRIRRARVDLPSKRLLLLRVFGAADKRESLLDWLEDTWRFVGRIDLIAGTDLVVRTLGSRMLEAFLLGRTDKQFLHTEVDVDRRLSQLRAEMEGDAKYPINSVYCYSSAWKGAVERLAPESEVVLMDLRGFSSKNQGCVFELSWIVQRLDLTRIVLLTDASTDHPALENLVHSAWASQPTDSPNASNMQPVLTVVDTARRSSASSHALFMLLLNAAGLAEAHRGP